MNVNIPAHRVWKMNTRKELFEYVLGEIFQTDRELQRIPFPFIRRLVMRMVRVRFVFLPTRELKFICLTMARTKRDKLELWEDLMSKGGVK